MNHAYAEVDGKPALVQPEHVNLGLAIDVRDGRRHPPAARADHQGGRGRWTSASSGWPTRTSSAGRRSGKLAVDDFAGHHDRLTNPGTIGTEHSVPRLMAGQGCIVGVGAMEYPAAYQGASEETLARLAISKTVTLTSTYDHRIIQGAQSGRLPAADPPAAARRGRLLRRDLRGAADPVRAGPLGPGHPGRRTRTTSPSRPGCTS